MRASKLGIVSFFIWIVLCLSLYLLKAFTLFWISVYTYVILAIVIMMTVAFLKFRMGRFFKSSEGRIFGTVTFSLLFIFLCELAWIVISILGATVPSAGYQLFFTVFANISRGSAYVFVLYLMIRAARSCKVSFRSNLVWVLISIGVILAFDQIVLHPVFSSLIASGSLHRAVIGISDLIMPVLNIVLLLVSLSVFISMIRISKYLCLAVLGIVMVCLFDLVFIAMNATLKGWIGFVSATGFAILTLLLAHQALRSEVLQSRITLDKLQLEILAYIKMHPGCIKKEIYRNFSITRMAAHERIRRLLDLDLVSSTKTGRTQSLSLTKAGSGITDRP